MEHVDWSEKLKTMQDSWREDVNTAPGVPEGEYTMLLQDAYLKEAKSGNMMIIREHLITEGEHAGTVVYDNLMLTNENGPYFIGLFFQILGEEAPVDIMELEAAVLHIADKHSKYLADVKRNGDFSNVRITELLEESTGKLEPEPKLETTQGTVKKKKKAETPTKDELVAFCKGWDIVPDKDATVPEIINLIKTEYDWTADELDEDELRVCKMIGVF